MREALGSIPSVSNYIGCWITQAQLKFALPLQGDRALDLAAGLLLWRARVSPLMPGCTHVRPASAITDSVSERLRRWTRNPLGSARRGSNPLAVDYLFMATEAGPGENC